MTAGPVCTLPKQCRLRKPEEFRTTLRSKVVFESFSLKLHVKSVTTSHARIGLTVAKRVERKAARRNRIKRLIREAFRKHRHMLLSLDCVVQLRRPVDKTSLSHIYQEAAMLFNKAARQS